MKSHLRVYLDPIQQKVVKDFCQVNMSRALYCSSRAKENGDASISCEFYNEYLAMKYLLERIESGKDEVLTRVR